MRVIVAGLGVQGHKRRRFAGADFVASVDPVNKDAEYRSIAASPWPRSVPRIRCAALPLCPSPAPRATWCDWASENCQGGIPYR